MRQLCSTRGFYKKNGNELKKIDLAVYLSESEKEIIITNFSISAICKVDSEYLKSLDIIQFICDVSALGAFYFACKTEEKNEISLLEIFEDSYPLSEGSVLLLAKIIMEEEFLPKKIKLTSDYHTDLIGYRALFNAAQAKKISIDINIWLRHIFQPSATIPISNQLTTYKQDLDYLISEIAHHSLTQFTLRKNHGFGNFIVQYFANVMRDKQNTILHLSLANNAIDASGFLVVAAALENNDILCSLDLSYNKPGTEGLCALEHALIKNNKLLRLILCAIDTEIKGIAKALLANCSLLSLNLRENIINEDDAAELAAALKVNCSLEYLNLSNTNISDGGVAELKTALLSNTKSALSELILCENKNISNAGVLSLSALLSETRIIRRLNLSKIGPINFAALQIFIAAIKINRSLSQIDFPDFPDLKVLSANINNAPQQLETFNTDRKNLIDNAIDVIAKNQRIVRCNFGIGVPQGDFLIAQLKLHKKMCEQQSTHWQSIASLLSFVTANYANPLKYSVLPLIFGIVAMAKEDKDELNERRNEPINNSTEQQAPLIESKLEDAPKVNLDNFMNTLFFDSHLKLAAQTRQSQSIRDSTPDMSYTMR